LILLRDAQSISVVMQVVMIAKPWCLMDTTVQRGMLWICMDQLAAVLTGVVLMQTRSSPAPSIATAVLTIGTCEMTQTGKLRQVTPVNMGMTEGIAILSTIMLIPEGVNIEIMTQEELLIEIETWICKRSNKGHMAQIIGRKLAITTLLPARMAVTVTAEVTELVTATSRHSNHGGYRPLAAVQDVAQLMLAAVLVEANRLLAHNLLRGGAVTARMEQGPDVIQNLGSVWSSKHEGMRVTIVVVIVRGHVRSQVNVRESVIDLVRLIDIIDHQSSNSNNSSNSSSKIHSNSRSSENIHLKQGAIEDLVSTDKAPLRNTIDVRGVISTPMSSMATALLNSSTAARLTNVTGVLLARTGMTFLSIAKLLPGVGVHILRKA